MKLYLTIMGKLVDSIVVDPSRRTDKIHIESRKQVLLNKHKRQLYERRCPAEFYFDPIPGPTEPTGENEREASLHSRYK